MDIFTYYFWTFMLGAFLGVVIETLWCIYKYKKLESRKGLIFGPFNALYGVAAVLLSLTINMSSHKSLGRVFLIGVIVASLVEYLCSYYQEKITGTISWDYKDFKWNLNGRINLVYSIMWGILTMVWFKYFMPIIDDSMHFFVNKKFLTMTAFIFMLIDCIVSLCAVVRRKKRHENIYAKTKIQKHFDYFYNDKVLDKIYANSKFVD